LYIYKIYPYGGIRSYKGAHRNKGYKEPKGREVCYQRALTRTYVVSFGSIPEEWLPRPSKEWGYIPKPFSLMGLRPSESLWAKERNKGSVLFHSICIPYGVATPEGNTMCVFLTIGKEKNLPFFTFLYLSLPTVKTGKDR
jgi:hypothetical protein